MKEGSEIFCEYTLNRLNRALKSEPLSDRQITLIRCALTEDGKFERHPVDLRLSIPLGYLSFYLCLFAGRDRRRSSLRLYGLRWNRSLASLRRNCFLAITTALSFGFAVLLFAGLYKVKKAMGIDIFPNFHLTDLASWVGI